jgi:hypothetical protein
VSDALAHTGEQKLVDHQAFTAWGKLSRDKAGQLTGVHPWFPRASGDRTRWRRAPRPDQRGEVRPPVMAGAD